MKERTKQFALRIVRLFRALPREVPTTMRTRVPKHPLPLFILIFVFGIVGCRIPTEPPPPLLHLLAESQARWSRSEAIGEFVKAGMQPKADPCNDFYQYACGGWSENSVAQQVGLEGAIGLSQVRAWKLLDDMVRSQSDDDRQAGMRKFYASCADGEAIERRGIAPLKTWLGEMDGPASMESFMATLGRLHRWGIPALFTLDVVPDAGGAARYTVEMRQGGLGLYAPEQYLNDSREASSTRERYRRNIEYLLNTLEEHQYPPEAADMFTELESQLARRFLPPYRLSPEPAQTLSIEQLEDLTGLPWKPYARAIGVGSRFEVRLTPIEYFRDLGKLLSSYPPDILRLYLRFRAFRDTAGFLGKVGLGLVQLYSMRWFGCVTATEQAAGSDLWREYSRRHNGEEKRRHAEEIWHAVQGAFADKVEATRWLEPQWASVLEKVRSATAFVGFPAELNQPTPDACATDNYFDNMMAVRVAWMDSWIDLVGRPVEAAIPAAPPSIFVPAYYPRFNQIVIPQAILEPPLFDARFPAAVNFGALGTIIAHELAHTLDRYGRKFDAHGGMIEWDSAAAGELEQHSTCLARHYDHFEAAPRQYSTLIGWVQPALLVNSERTADENWADTLGVRVAFEAYRRWVSEHPTDSSVVSTLTPEQLFFVAFAQNWCGEPNKEIRRFLAQYDVHVPPRARVNATVAALPEFSAAFHCADGAPLHPKEICQIP